MGRPGGGGRSGGGGSRSGGMRSSGARSGGSRSSRSSSRPMGGSRTSRPMGGGSSFGGGGFGGGLSRGYNPPPRHPRPPRHYSGRRVVYTSGGSRGSSGCSSILAYLIIFIAIIMILASVVGAGGGSSSVPTSTVDREKIDSGYGYNSDCIYDELGWFDNESRTEGRLKDFYEETGVQPYIIILDYDAKYGSTYEEKEKYACEQIYKEYEGSEYSVMYVYFAQKNEEANQASANPVIDEVLVLGDYTETVMDEEAIDIFYAYLDKNWYTDLSADDMFVKTFNSTADRIMDKSTTGKDVAKYAIIAVAVIAGGFIIVKLVKLKHKREKEEAEETERILNTPMESLVDEELKDTMAKYDKKE